MAMTQQQSNLISQASSLARQFLDKDGAIIQLDILNEEYGKTITQADIDAIPTFANAGLTVAQFQSAVFHLKAIHAAMSEDLSSFVTVANL